MSMGLGYKNKVRNARGLEIFHYDKGRNLR